MFRLERRFYVFRSARAAIALLVSSAVSGCFVTIADPAADSTGGAPNAGGSLSSGGSPASGSSGGGLGGGGVLGGRDAGNDGAKACSTCTNLANVKVHGCSDGGCTIVECMDGFVDCDGDATTGCETDFHVQAGDANAGARARSLGSSGAVNGKFGE